MSPRKLGDRPEEPQLFQELLEEANIDGSVAPEREQVVELEDTLLPHAPEPESGTEARSAEPASVLSEGPADGRTPEDRDGPVSDYAAEELSLDFPGAEDRALGYEEFAEVPTGSYQAAETPYSEDGDLSAYSATGELTSGERRSKKVRPESRTGAIPQVPLKELNESDVKEMREDIRKKKQRQARRRNRILAWVFCGFVFAMLILLWAMPKTYFSDEERSVLAAEPTFTPQTVFDGRFEEDAETYVSDHFPFRSFWIGLNSYYNLGSGRPLINGVYVGSDGYFIEEPTENDEAGLAANMDAVRAFITERSLPASFLAVPSTGYIMNEMLPQVHLPYHDADILASARLHLDGYADWIDIAEDLRAESAVEQVYYRTDHHWTTLGAYIGYIRWAQQKGITPTAVDRFRISYYDGFRGTTYAKVLLWGVKPDMIQLWESGGSYTVEMSDGNEAPEVTDTFYDIPALSGYDPYMVFFGGNHGLMHIHNNDAEAAGSLLLIKDSFANSFIPFIAPHYADIYVVDPRYYKNLRGLCDQTQLDEILFVYSSANLIKDQDLGLIDM